VSGDGREKCGAKRQLDFTHEVAAGGTNSKQPVFRERQQLAHLPSSLMHWIIDAKI
jgi:hypothetical protein